MDQSIFNKHVQKEEAQRLKEIQKDLQPTQLFTMSPLQAIQVEKQLNSVKDGWSLGYLLVPIRRQDQKLFKKGKKKGGQKTFFVEQETILLDFYRQLQFVKNKITKKEFHCFMTLEQLRRNPLSKYFMCLPDPLYLKLYDYNKIINQRFDIRMIANKLLRGKYENHEQFQIDMVKMIQNFRIYFINDLEMFDVSIKFQDLFWSFYENESIHIQALQKYKLWKKMCTAKKMRPKREKSYSFKKRQQLATELNKIPHEDRIKIQNKILDKIQQQTQKRIQVGNLNLFSMRDRDMEYFEQQIHAYQKKKKEGISYQQILMRQYEMRQEKNSQNQFYFEDQEERDIKFEGQKQELGKILNQMQIPDVDSDQND